MKGESINFHSELIAGCKQGNAKAQFEVYRLYSKAMYNTTLRILNNTAEAEDTMQEAFLLAFSKISTFRESVSFGAWLKRIVVNKALDVMRARKVVFTEYDAAKTVATESSFIIENEEAAEEKVRQIREAIATMPDGYRVVLTLSLLEGYDHDEISLILGIRASTSRSQLARAKKKLIEMLSEQKN